MKVLLVIDTLEIGGAERSLLEIFSRLQAVRAVVCQLYPGARLRPAFERAGIEVISLDLPGRYAFGRGARRVEEVAARVRPDLLHATLFRASMVARRVSHRTGLPLVDSFVNDSYGSARKRGLSPLGRLKLGALQLVDRRTAHRVDRFVANSRAVRDANCRSLGVSADRCTVIHRGRDPRPLLEAGSRETAAARRAIGVPDGAVLLLNLARLEPRKGQEEILRALARLRVDRPELFLVLAGEGPQRPQLAELARRLDLVEQVRLVGTVERPAPLLAACDVFVFPSHYEGFPGALIEAMMAGRPIVASDIPPHREALEHPRTARLVPPRDPIALAEALAWMLDHPEAAAAMGGAARREALQRFDVDPIARAHEELYRRVLEASAAGRGAEAT